MREEKILRTTVYLTLIIGFLVLCTASVGFVTAKYVSESSASDAATVACFSPSLVSETNIDISGIKKPSDSVERNFKAQNFTGDDVSEVKMKYTIILKSSGNLPLKFTLYSGGGSELAVWDCDGISGKQEYKYECPLAFSPSVSQTHEYALKAEWLASRNGERFSGLTDAIYLAVEWEQID
ncbi:MAG: hypothetical protein ACI4M6_06465 [Christensenellaceae bacterium]